MTSINFPPQKIVWPQLISHLKKIVWPQLTSHLNELIGESSWWSVPSIRRNSALKIINLNLNTMEGDGGKESSTGLDKVFFASQAWRWL